MRLVILEGAIYIQDKEQIWLFGAPENISSQLKESGLDSPHVVFTTSLRAPGVGTFHNVLRFKEKPLSMNGLKAEPIFQKHGTDYRIETNYAKILFSERGDVSVADTEGYDLAIIKNKHRADDLPGHVITWPWVDSEYIINEHGISPVKFPEERFKVWSSDEDVPDNLKKLDDVPLTLSQSNQIAKIAEASGEGGEENWAIAISTFKKGHEKSDSGWVKKDKETIGEMSDGFRSAFEQQYGIDPHTPGKCWYVDADPTKGIAYVEELGSYYAIPFNYGDDGQIVYDLNKDKWMPADKQWVINYKEMTDSGPTQRFGDVLISAIHTAYNDVSDHYYKMGYMDEEERKGVGKSIGDALDALRSSANFEVMKRVVRCSLPDKLKETLEGLSITPPSDISLPWSAVYKNKEGEECWASISSVAVWDNQGELFQTKAMDFAIKFGDLINFKGPLRFRHVPGLDGGDCTHQSRIGDFLFEKGTFRNTPLGQTMKERMREGTYATSLGLLFSPNDLTHGVYEKAVIMERSMTKKPAVGPTKMTFIGKDDEVNILTLDQLKEVSEELGIPIDEVQKLYEGAIASGSAASTKEELSSALKAAGGAMAAADDEEEDEDEGDEMEEKKMTKKEMKDILQGLTVAEFKELKALLTVVEKETDEEEVVEEEETYTSDKSEERFSALEQQLTKTQAMMRAQTKALQSFINNQSSGEISDLMATLPREQAMTFKSSAKQAPALDDGEVMNRLKSIEESLKSISGSGRQNQIYDLFTSSDLNQKR